MAIRTITLFDPVLGLISGSGDAYLTLTDDNDYSFEVPDQNGSDQTATLDGVPATINSITEAIGPQLVTALVGGVSVELSLTPVQIVVEAGLIDASYVYLPGLPDGAEITAGLSVSLLFPNDVSIPLCLASDTLVRTPTGLREIGSIEPGDIVDTIDGGPQRVVWVGRRTVNFEAEPAMARHRPVLIRKNAFGVGLPYRDLTLSPQHCVVFDSWEAEYFTGETEAMVPAKFLINGRTVVSLKDCETVDYVHLLFDTHHVIWAYGLPVESLYLGDIATDSILCSRTDEMLDLLPDVRLMRRNMPRRARARLKRPEAAVLFHAFSVNDYRSDVS